MSLPGLSFFTVMTRRTATSTDLTIGQSIAQTPTPKKACAGTCGDCFFWINRVPDEVINGYHRIGYCVGMQFDTENETNAIVAHQNRRHKLSPEPNHASEGFQMVTYIDFGCVRFQDKQWTMGAATQETKKSVKTS